MRRAGFLYNGQDPSSVRSNEFAVTEGAVRLTAKTWAGFTIETALGIGDTESWTPVSRYGAPLSLEENNCQHVELVPGRYRAVPKNPPIDHEWDLVYFEEDENLKASANVEFEYAQVFV